jgi:hypothetical protein
MLTMSNNHPTSQEELWVAKGGVAKLILNTLPNLAITDVIKLKAAINRHYIAKEAVVAAIGEDDDVLREGRDGLEVWEDDQSIVRNELRKEIRQALNLDTSPSQDKQ